MSDEQKGFDLSQLDTSTKSSDGVEFELRHPVTGDPLDSFMTVCGQDSAQYSEANDKAAKKVRERMMKDGRSHRLPSDIVDEQFEKMLGCLISWRQIVDGGKDIKFSSPNARKILEKYKFFIGQISEAVHDRSRFLPGDRK